MVLQPNSSLGRLILRFLDHTQLDIHTHTPTHSSGRIPLNEVSKKLIFTSTKILNILPVIVYIVWNSLRIRCSSYAVPSRWLERFVFSRHPADRPGIGFVFCVVGTGSSCCNSEGTSDGGNHFHLASRFRIRGAIISLLHTSIMKGCVINHRNKFTFTLSA